MWLMLGENKLEIVDTVHTNKITAENWKTFFENPDNSAEKREQPLIDEKTY